MSKELSEYTDDELLAELSKRKITGEAADIRSLDKNGITVKDIVMVYGLRYYGDDSSGVYKFAPHVRRANNKLEFGYDISEFEYNEWGEFLPSGFSESEECIFEYFEYELDDGNPDQSRILENALNILDKCGIAHERNDKFFEY